MLVSTRRIWLKPSLILLGLVALYVLSMSSIRAKTADAPPDGVRLIVVITAKDSNTKDTITTGQIQIIREKPGDVEGPITGRGNFTKAEVDFKLSKAPYKWSVAVPTYNDFHSTITAEMLREAANSPDKTLRLTAELTKSTPPPTPTPSFSPTPEHSASTNGGGWESLKATMAAFANFAIWWLGALFLMLLIGAVLAYFMYGRRLVLHKVGTTTLRNDVTTLIDLLGGLLKSVKEIAKQQEGTNKHLEKTDEALEDIKKQLAHEVKTLSEQIKQSGTLTKTEDYRTTQAESYSEPANRIRSETDARNAYRRLMSGDASGDAFIYLRAEGGTALGALEDKFIYLAEDNSQGAFVLMLTSDSSGLVFPNPGLRFRQSALSPLFPTLTEDEFERNKENIQPCPARKFKEGFWRVEA